MNIGIHLRAAGILVLALGAISSTGCAPGEPGTDSGSPPTNMCGRVGLDSDGDGLIDTDEDLNGNGIVDPGECDPLSADTDSDGLIDVVEVGCDGLYKGVADTRCDLADTDGDGLTDGFEDGNGNGNHDSAFGETSPILADTDGDRCTDGEESAMGTDPNVADSDGDGIADGFEDHDCDGVIDPDDGETDPNIVDTDGDGIPDNAEPTFICAPESKLGGGGLRPAELYENDRGDWRVALEATSTEEGRLSSYTPLVINGVGGLGTDVRAAARMEYAETPPGSFNTVDVGGFVVSLPLDGNGDGVIDPNSVDALAVRDRLVGIVMSVFAGAGAATMLRTNGTNIISWEGFDAVVSTVIEVTLAAPSDAGVIRDTLIPAFLGLPASAVSGGSGPIGIQDTTFIISFETVWRAAPDPTLNYPGRAVVLGGVARAVDWDDNDSVARLRVGDLAGGGSLAQYGDSEEIECDPFMGSSPTADILWAIDDSGSTVSYRDSIKDNVVDLFTRALAAGLDFRMGVISLGPAAAEGPRAGYICDPPVGAISAGIGVSCDVATPTPVNGGLGCGGACHGNDQPNEGRWILPTELDQFSWCVCYPPNGDIETEAGLHAMRAAVLEHLPRSAGNTLKIRPGATLSVIFVADEEPDVPDGAGNWFDMSVAGSTPGSPEWNDNIQPMIDLFSGVPNPLNPYPPGVGPGDTAANVHGMLDLTGVCYSVPSYGYTDIVNAMGGITGSVCAPNLGPTLQVIIDEIIANSSPMYLERTPIVPTMACAIDDTEVMRGRGMGFDYSGSTGTVVFFGLGAAFVDADIACSYEYFVDDTPLSEGPGVGGIE